MFNYFPNKDGRVMKFGKYNQHKTLQLPKVCVSVQVLIPVSVSVGAVTDTLAAVQITYMRSSIPIIIVWLVM